MPSQARGIRVAAELEAAVATEAAERQKSWSNMAQELLEEAIRLRRSPGIVFADGPSGRRAVVAGSGLDVWEVIAAWKQGGEDLDGLRQNYSWMTVQQLRAALSYYQLYPAEIDARLERERHWTSERLLGEHPFSRPQEPSR